MFWNAMRFLPVMAVAVFGLSSTSSTAWAEEEEALELERVTVVAPRITRESGRMGEVLTVEMDRIVDFDDLDITRTSDFFQLENRINDAAEQICEELTRQYPRGQPRTEVCIARAVDDAMSQAREFAHARDEGR